MVGRLIALAVLARSVSIAVGQLPNMSVGVYSLFPNPSPVGSGAGASFSLVNNGTSPASNVMVTINIVPMTGASVYNVSVSRGMFTSTAPYMVEWTLGTVFPGQSSFAGFDVTADTTGSYTSTVAVTTSSTQTTTADDVRIATITFNSAAPSYYMAGVQVTEAEPVSTFSGKEVFVEPPDLNLEGPGLPIFFQRHYDGALAEDGVVNSALGPNWQHNYDIALTVADTNATVAFRRGRILRFQNDGSNWNLTERKDIPFRLIQTGPDFTLGDPRSQFRYFFNGSGLLTRIEDGRGNTNFLSYNGTLLTNVNDGLNRQLTLQYDGGGQLTNVSDGVRSVQFTHGSPLAGVVDALGFVTSYSYTTNPNNPALLTARTLPEGNTPFAQTYNAAGRVSAQTDGAANTTSFGYGPVTAGYQTVITNPLGHVTVHNYSGSGEFSQFTDEAGKTVFLGQDAAGRRSFVRDRHNISTFITYSATNGFPTLINLPSNPDEAFAYSPRVVAGFTFFDLTQAFHPDGTTNVYAYDAGGNLIRHTNRIGDVWHYGRNPRGQLLSITNPLGGIASFGYDGAARLVASSDSDLGVTTYEYDALNRLTNLIHPNPTRVQFAYDALDRLTSVTDERTNTTMFQYDGNSRFTNVVNALGQSTRYEYDAVDRLRRTLDRLGNATSFGYDPRSLLSAITNRNGFITRFEHDERHRLTAVVNPANVTNRLEYDNEGLLTAAINPLGETGRWQRDVMGYVTNFTDPLGNRFGLTLDVMKRVTGVTNPLGQKATFAYDRRGLLTNVTREAGIAATYRYNPLGLLTNLLDPNSSQWNFAYTSVGRMTNFADPIGRVTRYEYDARGRPSRTVFPDDVTQTNTYDGANNVTQLAWSDGTLFNFTYDPLDRLTNAAGSDPIEFSYDAMDRVTNTRQVGLNFGATYDADGRLTSVTYSNGLLTVFYTYDSRDRLIHVGDSLTSHGIGFSYNDADRLTGIARSNGVNTTYTYNALGHVTRIQDGSIIDIQYTFDAVGQVTETDYVTVPIDPTSIVSNLTASFTYDAASQISSAGYQYDPRGRLTNMPNAMLVWDGASRLVTISNVTLGYNALGDLVARVESGNTNRFFYNYAVGLTPIMAERNDNTGQFSRCYVWSPGGILLYIISLPGNTVSYPHFDRVGSTLALTGAGGAVTDAYAYDPYGRLISQSGGSSQPFRFVGRSGVRHEPAGGLAHMRARYYNPRTTSFLSPEPVWPVLGNPLKLNPYQYALSDPLGFIDPLGTDEIAVERPVDKMSEIELTIELFNRELARLQYENFQRTSKFEITDAAKRQLGYEIKNYIMNLKHSNSKWLEALRKRVKRMRETEQFDRQQAEQRASQEAGKQAEQRARVPKPRTSQQPGGSVIGPPVPLGGSPTPVVPLPEVNPQPSGGTSPPPKGEHHGFLYGGAAGGGVPVSYTSPDTYKSLLLPRSIKVKGLISGDNGAMTHQGPRTIYTSEAEAIGPFDDTWFRLTER